MNKKAKIIAIAIVVIIIILMYPIIFFSSTNQKNIEFKVKRNTTEEQFNLITKKSLGISFPFGIYKLAKIAGYKLSPCRIDIPPKTNILNFILLLRKNRHQTVNLVITSGVYKKQIIEKITKATAIEKDELEMVFADYSALKKFNINEYTWPAIFVPNTYNVSYKIDVEGLFFRLVSEQNKFWNSASRISKSEKQKLTPLEVITVASIVEKESSKVSEYGKIAAVYINRLRKGMKLQADPTIVFIKGIAERVRGDEDLNRQSPYNTYLNKGLPPGPICIPSVQAIDSVLNYTYCDYLFFCAKSDFSGYHLFEKSYSKHKMNAKKFHIALNEQEKIRAKKKGNKSP